MKKIIYSFLFIYFMISITSCNDDGLTGVYDEKKDYPKKVEDIIPITPTPKPQSAQHDHNHPPKKRIKSRLKELMDSDPVYKRVINLLEEMDGGKKSTFDYD